MRMTCTKKVRHCSKLRTLDMMKKWCLWLWITWPSQVGLAWKTRKLSMSNLASHPKAISSYNHSCCSMSKTTSHGTNLTLSSLTWKIMCKNTLTKLNKSGTFYLVLTSLKSTSNLNLHSSKFSTKSIIGSNNTQYFWRSAQNSMAKDKS